MAELTVGIPVHNAMPYLPECIQSILGQSYGEFELLVINDGSGDGSLEYLRSIRDPRLRVLSQTNKGLTSTLNRMLVEARTPWLVRQDADDVSYPNRLALTMEFIQNFPQAGMFYSLADYYPDSSVGQYRSTRGAPGELREIVSSGYLLSFCHTSVTLNIKKTLDVGGYRFDLHVEDKDLWWRMAIAHDIHFMPEVTVGFRQNLHSVSSLYLEEQYVNALYVQYLLLSHLWERQPRPIEAARPALTSMISEGDVRSKRHLRAFNIEMGNRNFRKASWHFMLALWASPLKVASRAADEIIRKERCIVGVSPQSFQQLGKILWPDRAAEPIRQNRIRATSYI